METGTNGNQLVNQYLTPLAVVIGAVIIAFALAYERPDAGTPPPTDTGAPDIADVKTEGNPFIGDEDAPVTIAYWFDYQCPFCKQFEQTTMLELYKNYVAKGQLRIVFKDFQFLGPDSTAGAVYARAVWDLYPHRFYDWYQAMFEAQDEEHGGFGNEATVKTLTATVPGIDAEKVEKNVADNRSAYLAAIQADRTEGSSFGVKGTPGLIIGTSLLPGAYPYEAVAPLVDTELSK